MIVSIMAHILAKIEGVKVTDIKDQLVSDMTKHAEHLVSETCMAEFG